MIRKLLFFMCCFCSSAAISQNGEVNPLDYISTNLYDAGDVKNYPSSLVQLQSLADIGDANSQNLLGILYVEGIALERDEEKAFKLISNSAKQGFSPAEYNLGRFYRLGIGCDMGYDDAVHWFTIAADHGNERAAYTLGYMYFKGFGLVQDYKKSISWFELSSWPMAKNFLGICYYFGYGVEKNEDKAIVYFGKSQTLNSEMYLKHIAENTNEDAAKSLEIELKDKESKSNTAVSKETINKSLAKADETFIKNKKLDAKSLNGKWKGKLIELDWSGEKIVRILPVSFDFTAQDNQISYKIDVNKTVNEEIGIWEDNGIYFNNLHMALDWTFNENPNSKTLDYQLLSSQMKFKNIGTTEYLIGNIETFSTDYKEPGPPMRLVLRLAGDIDQDLNDEELLDISAQNEHFIVLYPNPFVNDLRIEYKLDNDAHVAVEVYSYNGNIERVLLDSGSSQKIGNHSYVLDGNKLPAGLYIVRVSVDNKVHSRIIIKN